MAYLRYYDYSRTIQDVNLQQIINSDNAMRLLCEDVAEAEAISYLTQKYDVESEFTATQTWQAGTYYANDLVELNFSVYNSGTSYTSGNTCTINGKCYKANASTTGTFDISKWDLLGDLYDLFHVTLPANEFNYKAYYKTGKVVFWKNKVYTALKDSPTLDHFSALQYVYTNNIPYANVFPDDETAGLEFWGVGVAYAVTALPTDLTKWTKGDNRSTQLVQKIVDICLYHLHSRIAQRNIPQIRMDRYAAAIAWLDMAKSGEVTADIPLRQPKVGGRIRWGSQVKRINDY